MLNIINALVGFSGLQHQSEGHSKVKSLTKLIALMLSAVWQCGSVV